MKEMRKRKKKEIESEQQAKVCAALNHNPCSPSILPARKVAQPVSISSAHRRSLCRRLKSHHHGLIMPQPSSHKTASSFARRRCRC
jgi:hypothetical protein